MLRVGHGARWLNQIEVYFSVLRRKALAPADFPDRDALATRILQFLRPYQTNGPRRACYCYGTLSWVYRDGCGFGIQRIPDRTSLIRFT